MCFDITPPGSHSQQVQIKVKWWHCRYTHASCKSSCLHLAQGCGADQERAIWRVLQRSHSAATRRGDAGMRLAAASRVVQVHCSAAAASQLARSVGGPLDVVRLGRCLVWAQVQVADWTTLCRDAASDEDSSSAVVWGNWEVLLHGIMGNARARQWVWAAAWQDGRALHACSNLKLTCVHVVVCSHPNVCE